MRTTGVVFLIVVAGTAGCAPHRATSNDVESGRLPENWYAGGAECGGRPAFRVGAYNADVYILRQPACTNYEKPFVYLIFGRDRALLFDTGAPTVDIATPVDTLIRQWLARRGASSIGLVVAHSHAHGDHVAGDSQFVRRAGAVVVGRDSSAVRAFFDVQHWPEDIGSIDLGGRVLDVIPIPGHQPASIALYDRRTGILLTGDTFYPGRLYVRDTAAFARSVDRLARFVRGHRVTHLLGAHVEQTSTPFVDYPIGTKDQPNEHGLDLAPAQLFELDSAVQSMRGHFRRLALRDVTIWPQTP